MTKAGATASLVNCGVCSIGDSFIRSGQQKEEQRPTVKAFFNVFRVLRALTVMWPPGLSNLPCTNRTPWLENPNGQFLLVT